MKCKPVKKKTSEYGNEVYSTKMAAGRKYEDEEKFGCQLYCP